MVINEKKPLVSVLKTGDGGWKKYLAPSIVVGVLTIMVSLGIFWYTAIYSQPKLSYEIFDSYPLSENETVTMIVFQNTGRSSATNIVINIECTGLIQNHFFSSPDEIEIIESAGHKLRVNMNRLVHGTKTSIYIQTSRQYPTPFSIITLTSDQGAGKEYVRQQSSLPIYIENLIFVIAALSLILTSINMYNMRNKRSDEAIQAPEIDLRTESEPELKSEPETKRYHSMDDNPTEPRKSHIVGTQVSSLKNETDVVHSVNFSYAPESPSRHGWIVESDRLDKIPGAKPIFKKNSSSTYGKSMEISQINRYYMDYHIEPPNSLSKNVEIVVQPKEGYSFYIEVTLKKFGEVPINGWIVLFTGDGITHKKWKHEWWVYCNPKQLEDGWFKYGGNIPNLVKETFGQDGWEYDQHCTRFRLRGNMIISRISLLR